MCEGPKFLLLTNSLSDSTSNTLKLKEKHNYMFQIQGQMAILNMQWVDFVVWTKSGISYQRIPFNSVFWNDNMLPKLHAFYLYGIVPELFSERLKRGLNLYMH